MGPPAREPLGLYLTRVSRTVSRAFDDALAAAGGSLPVWLVLISLKRGQLASQRELAEAVGVQGATLSHHLNAMEAAGLVTRRRDPRNRRLHVVELTLDGEALFSRLREVAFAFDQRLRTGFTGQDIDRLEALLTRLRDNVGGLPGGPEPGQVDAQPVPQALLSRLAHGDDTAGFPGDDPAALHERGSEGGTQAAREMVTALAPVQARP